MTQYQVNVVGCSSGLAGVSPHSGDGPKLIQRSPYLNGLTINWQGIIEPPFTNKRMDEQIHHICLSLAQRVSELVRQQTKLVVMGGDHSCAIGTWSGVYDALHQQGEIGLIWIDAHMDSHTPETSETGRIHGMPLASLLGYGFPSLVNILHYAPKLKPENVCLIGVRSFESGEAELLKRLKVKVYYMEEVKQRGFETVLKEATEMMRQRTIGYGISLDLDGIDPEDAPGVDVPEPNGIPAKDILAGFTQAVTDPRLVLTEIVEFDPMQDKDHRTEKLVIELLKILAKK